MAAWLAVVVGCSAISFTCDANVLFLATSCHTLSSLLLLALRFSSHLASNRCAAVALGIYAPAPAAAILAVWALLARDHQVSRFAAQWCVTCLLPTCQSAAPPPSLAL